MNAAVAQWFLRTGAVSGSYRVSQGGRLGRAGDVTITADLVADVLAAADAVAEI
jgi:predicted PhzF superfamily epimerase YddE/YHI9